MSAQLARRFRASLRYAINSPAGALSALVTIGLLPTLCDAQSLSPTPQPDGVPITAEQSEQVTPENWAIHGQATLTPMLQPAFRSPYQGPQSLSPGRQRQGNRRRHAYLGLRPWQGAEIWINPEVDQGFGLSDTFGVAGYVSGEAYKVGEANPYFLIQRGFLAPDDRSRRRTEQLDADLNQLARHADRQSACVTLGKFSVVDVFDTNKYAHDPRNDFLNWSIIDKGAFDYAANAWGYTYGAAAEWYQDWWTVRTGLFDLSTAPNAAISRTGFFDQAQFVAELEERHTLWDQPGKLKFLYWLTWGDLGTYPDALALAAATGQTPSTAAVRRFRTKYGIGLNLEQQLASDLGLFLRASCHKAMSRRTTSPISTSRYRRAFVGRHALGAAGRHGGTRRRGQPISHDRPSYISPPAGSAG